MIIGKGRARPSVAAAAFQATVVAAGMLIYGVVTSTQSPVTARGESGETPQPGMTADYETLVYELLDAHAETAELAADLTWDPFWAAHLDYLQALQRTGRETLAQTPMEGP
jgi:DICT domain-containing protein